MLEHIIEVALEYLIPIFEIVGILVVCISIVMALVDYFKALFTRKHYHSHLGHGLAHGLEFLMGAEILKTVVTRDYKDLIVLGAIVLMRAAFSGLIMLEERHAKKSEAGEKEEH